MYKGLLGSDTLRSPFLGRMARGSLRKKCALNLLGLLILGDHYW